MLPRPPRTLAGRNIWFISVSYAPEDIGIGPYAAATAEHLAAAGAEVTVICGFPHYPVWRRQPGDRGRLRRSDVVNGLPTIRLWQVVPRRQSLVTRGAYEASFLVHGAIALRKHPRPDAVVVVTPSLGGALVGLLQARRHNVPLFVIVQDLTSAAVVQSGIVGGLPAARLTSALESRLLRAAHGVALAHHAFMPRCLDMGVTPANMELTPNWALASARQMSPSQQGNVDWGGKFVVLHAGNMGFKQGLEVVVDAARLADRSGNDDVLFVLMGDGNRRDAIAKQVNGLRTLQIMDPVSEDQLSHVLAAADVLLVTQRAEVDDMSVPSKLAAYFTAGKAVVGSVATDGGTASEIRRSGGGVVVPPQDPSALLDEVLELRRSPAVVDRMGDAGRAYSREHLSGTESLDKIAALVRCGLSASE